MHNVVLSPIHIDELVDKIASEVQGRMLNASNQPQQTSPEEFITREVAARKLGISLPTLHEYTKAGLIPAYRIGSRVRYKVSEIETSLQKVQSVKGKRGQI